MPGHRRTSPPLTRAERRASRRFHLLLAVLAPVFGMAHEIALPWLIHPQALGYIYPFSLLAAICAAGWAAARLSPPPR